MPKEINIIVQDDDYPQCNELQFIEIENGKGESIKIGEWRVTKEDRYGATAWAIRITQEDWDKLDG